MLQRLLFPLFLLLSLPAAADEAASSRLNALLTRVSSMQADFSQSTTDSRGQALQAQNGRMSVQRPGLFRWEVEKPAKQLIISNGSTIWIYDPELLQATKQKLDAQVGNTPALLLSGDPRKLAEAFAISEEKGSGGEQVFLLKPLAKDALFDQLRVRFKGNELTRMQLADSLGQKTDIRFTRISLNPKLPASLFEFTPPKGVDVIDEF